MQRLHHQISVLAAFEDAWYYKYDMQDPDEGLHVVWSPYTSGQGVAALQCLQSIRNAKVGKVGMSVLIQQDVGRLEIKMPDFDAMKLDQTL